MTSRITEVIVDCSDLERLADFWCSVLGYERSHSGDGWLAIGPARPERSDELIAAGPQAPAMAFVLVPEGKSSKNRVHVDVTPVSTTQDAEVERLTKLGAKRIDVGQRDVPWIVMADPEGNEFCVMPALSLDRTG